MVCRQTRRAANHYEPLAGVSAADGCSASRACAECRLKHTRECGLTSKLSDPAHRTLSKPETHGTTETQKPGSLKRMVRRRCTHISKNIQPTLSREPEMMSGLAAAHSNSTRRPRRTRGKQSASFCVFCVFCGQRISPSHQKA